MKNIDLVDVGFLIWISCMGAAIVISFVGDRDAKIECIRGGGNIVTIKGDKVCQIPQVKP